MENGASSFSMYFIPCRKTYHTSLPMETIPHQGGSAEISWGLQVNISSLFSYPELLLSAKNHIPFLLLA